MKKQFNKIFNESISLGKSAYKKFEPSLEKLKKGAIKNSSYLFAFLSQNELLKWSRSFIDATNNPNAYDDAVDAIYNETHIGGGNHRLFDESHTLGGIFEKVKDTYQDDSFLQEVIASVSVWFKDVTTPGGMPFVNIDNKNHYDQSAQWMSDNIPGASKQWFYDLHMYDVFEILTATLGAVGAVFSFKKEDYKKLNELLGSMSILSILSANPLMGISVIVITAYTYYTKKKKLNVKDMSKGVAKSAIAWIVFSILGLQLLIQIIILIVVYRLIKKSSIKGEDIYQHIKNIWNKYVMKNVKTDKEIYLLK